MDPKSLKISNNVEEFVNSQTITLHRDQILRVGYSDADNTLERFSITSIVPLTYQWTVLLETDDEFISQSHLSEDIIMKIKHLCHFEIITVYSK